MDSNATDKHNLSSPAGAEIPVAVISRLSPQTVEVVATILASGFVCSVLELIYLSFQYPAKLSAVAGIILPLLTALWHGHQILQRCKREKRDTDISD